MTTDALFTAAPDELERLRAENARLIHDIQAPDGYTWEWHCTRKDEELAKLRQALGLLTTLKPDMEVDALDPLDMAQQIVEYVSQSDDMTTAYLAGFHKRDAEIERLRDLVYAVPPTEHATGQTWKGACEANRDEVARLDNLLRTYRLPDEVVDIKVVIELRAEIKRLRVAYEQERKDCINLTEKVIPNLRAEIERLREECLDAREARDDWAGRWRDAQAEIERLRSQLAAMECGYKSFRDTAEEEFARLRSLIRARLAGPRVDYGTTHSNVLAWDREWLERAKEMVGDE